MYLIDKIHEKDMIMTIMCQDLKVLGKSVGGKSAKVLSYEVKKVKELSDGVTETQILQTLWKK